MRLSIKVSKTPKALLSIALQFSILLLSVAYPLLYPQAANATVTEGFVRFDRLATTSVVAGTACLKSSLSGQTNVVIVFPAGWTISQTASNWTTSTTNLPTDPVGGGAATAWPGIGTATSVNGLSVTFPGTALTVGTFYCFNFTGSGFSTLGPAGNNQTGQLKTQGGSPYIDSMDYATSVVAAAGEQITVTASVSAAMTFSLGANSIALGTLSTSSTAQGTPTITETISTNARNGWTTWVKSANGALNSAVSGGSISSPGSFDGTVEDLTSQAGYVVAAAAGSGSPTVYAEWLDGSNTNKGGHLATLFEQVATKTTPASSDTVVYTARAKAGATTLAGNDYTDTLTITAAGSF
ncbi:MAG TPA: hypothetical protein VMR77_02530 [Patescibacteria group bacterium]|jgi:hypothetical protein|nr:hypothetical protein [Patescibacteria group bacterium]